MDQPASSGVIFRIATRDVRRLQIRAFARELEIKVTRGRPFECLVTGDSELQTLNRRFRRRDYATDVLSFPAGNGSLGEIAISFDRARAQAGEQGHRAEDELRILMLHGVLHLLGMDHERDRGEMARAERRWRKELALPVGLIERVRA